MRAKLRSPLPASRNYLHPQRTRTASTMQNPATKSSKQQSAILDSPDPSVYEVTTKAHGPSGSLPLTEEMLTDWPSGDLFGLSQNAGMGWTATEVARDPYLILSTQGGLRGPDG